MITINPNNATTIIQKLALYCSSYLGNDLYYLKEVVFLLINIFGEDRLVEMLKNDDSHNKSVVRKIGEDWYKPKGMKKNLSKISEILEKVNKSYCTLHDRKLPKNKRDTVSYNDFIKHCTKFPKIENDFYALFVFLCQNSSIQNMNISPQYLKVLEQGKSFGGVQKEKIKDENNKLQ